MSFNQARDTLRNQQDLTDMTARLQNSLENPLPIKLVPFVENGKVVFEIAPKTVNEVADDFIALANAPVIAFAEAQNIIANRQSAQVSPKKIRRYW